MGGVRTGQGELANHRRQLLSNFSESAGPTFRATTLASTFGRFGPFRNPRKHWGFVQIQTDVDN